MKGWRKLLDGQQRLTSVFCAMFSKKVVETILSIPEDRKLKSDFGKKADLDLSTREKEFEHHIFLILYMNLWLVSCAKMSINIL